MQTPLELTIIATTQKTQGNTIMEKIAIIGFMAFFIFLIYRAHKSGGIKALFERSRNAPQHWDTFALLMCGVLLFTYILIKL